MRLKGKKRRKKKGLGYVGRKDETEFTQESLLGNSDNGAIKRNLEVTKNIQLG